MKPRDVSAVATLKRASGWAGLGFLPTIYRVFPEGPRGNATYHTINRYRQGVILNFSGHGVVYKFDMVVTIFALLAGLVLLGTATSIADLVATNLYRLEKAPGKGLFKWKLKLSATSNVLRAKRIESVAPDQVMGAPAASPIRYVHPHSLAVAGGR